VLFYSLPSFLSAGIFKGSTAKNKKKHLCVLRASAVKLLVPACPGWLFGYLSTTEIIKKAYSQSIFRQLLGS